MEKIGIFMSSWRFVLTRENCSENQFWRSGVLMPLLLCCGGWQRGAEAEPIFVDSTVEEGGWRFIATVDDTDATRRVDTLLVVPATGSTIEPGNLGGVLYRRDANGFWSAWAYNYGAADLILRSFATQEGIVSIPLGLVDSSGSEGGVDLFEEPTAFEKGLLTTDPLFEYLSANVDNPEANDALIAFLQQVGYAAANLPFEKFQSAQQPARAYVLDGLAVELSGLARRLTAAAAHAEKIQLRSSRDNRNIFETLYDWWCSSVTKTKWVGLPGLPPACTPFVTMPGATFTATLGIEEGPVSVGIAWTGVTTCFVQSCSETVTRSVTYNNSCLGTTTRYIEYGTRSYQNYCCVAGPAVLPPTGIPPCAPTQTPGSPVTPTPAPPGYPVN